MNPFSLPSLLSTVLLTALGIVLYLQNPRARINRVFSALMFVSALSNGSAFLFHLSTTADMARLWTKPPYVFAFLSQLLGVYYVLILTGREKRLHERVFGLPLKAHITAVVIGNLLFLGLLVLTDTLLPGVEFNALTGYEHTYGPLFSAAVFYFTYVGILEIVLMVASYRETAQALDRIWLRYNLIGFLIIFVFGGLLALYLPLQGIPSHSFTFVPFTVAAFIFYYALLRHQIGQIQELNENLEQKVEARTSELQRAQAQLIQSEKMASLGQLVAGIAHEINNPLGSLKSNNDIVYRSLQKLKEMLAEPQLAEVLQGQPRLMKILTNTEELSRVSKIAGERIALLVQGLRHFARLDEADYQKTDLHECLNETLLLLRHQLKNRIDVIKKYDEIPEIECKPRQLNQVFMNLLVNAIQSIEGQGQITIATTAENGRVQIRFKDSGAGINPENLDKIFNPGFTTKGVGVGTGLGLPICYSIVVEEHGGEIKVASEIGKGSEFTVELEKRIAHKKEAERTSPA